MQRTTPRRGRWHHEPAGSRRAILLYQNTADHFESWAYAWALVFPASTGLGQMIYGSLKERKEMVMTGGRR